MKIHKFSTERGSFILCNSRGKTTSMNNLKDVTCKKCLKLLSQDTNKENK